MWLHITVLERTVFKIKWQDGLLVAKKKCFCQVCLIGVKSEILGTSASWKDGLSMRLLAEQCDASLKRSSGLLGCLVLCLVCRLLGEMPQLSLERVEEVPVQDSS